jgi:hypothetical protein
MHRNTLTTTEQFVRAVGYCSHRIPHTKQGRRFNVSLHNDNWHWLTWKPGSLFPIQMGGEIAGYCCNCEFLNLDHATLELIRIAREIGVGTVLFEFAARDDIFGFEITATSAITGTKWITFVSKDDQEQLNGRMLESLMMMWAIWADTEPKARPKPKRSMPEIFIGHYCEKMTLLLVCCMAACMFLRHA